VPFGAIDLAAARRAVLVRRAAGPADAQAFLRDRRRRYRRAGAIWLFLDRASAHTAPATPRLAAALGIVLRWLPQPHPALHPVDQLWRELKRLVAATRRADSVDAPADAAAAWVLGLTPTRARRKAGMASDRFGLKRLRHAFWQPT
jgi:hypothetical protein